MGARGAQAGAGARDGCSRQQGTRPRRAARPVGCALSLFFSRFDSILFLSRFLDIVREPGS